MQISLFFYIQLIYEINKFILYQVLLLLTYFCSEG